MEQLCQEVATQLGSGLLGWMAHLGVNHVSYFLPRGTAADLGAFPPGKCPASVMPQAVIPTPHPPHLCLRTTRYIPFSAGFIKSSLSPFSLKPSIGCRRLCLHPIPLLDHPDFPPRVKQLLPSLILSFPFSLCLNFDISLLLSTLCHPPHTPYPPKFPLLFSLA